MNSEGDLILQPGGKRFASNFAVTRVMCPTCGATVFKKTEFGHLEKEGGDFIVGYLQFNCVECQTALPVQYVKPKEEKKK